MQSKKNENAVFTISELAEKASVNVETIRFYERKKILNKPLMNQENLLTKFLKK